MKAIISRMVGDKFPEVGMNDRFLTSSYKSQLKVIQVAKEWAKGKPYRIEFFTDSGIYGEPFKVIEGGY